MALVLVYMAMILAMLSSVELMIWPKNDSILRHTGGYSPSNTALVTGYSVNPSGLDMVDENKTMARNADTAAVRVCRELNYEMKTAYMAGDMTCAAYGDSTQLFTFIAPAGTLGSLDTLYAQPKTATFSCANIDQYGRYLFSRALPQNMITGKNVRFNLTNVVAGNSDPCGFREIIF